TNPKGFYVVRVTEIVEPQPLTLEEAKPQIEEVLRKDKTLTQIETTVSETRNALTSAMETGKSFSAAAAEAGFEVNEITPFSASKPPTDLPDSNAILPTIYDTRSGEI